MSDEDRTAISFTVDLAVAGIAEVVAYAPPRSPHWTEVPGEPDLLRQRGLTPAEALDVERYLAAKWGFGDE